MRISPHSNNSMKRCLRVINIVSHKVRKVNIPHRSHPISLLRKSRNTNLSKVPSLLATLQALPLQQFASAVSGVRVVFQLEHTPMQQEQLLLAVEVAPLIQHLLTLQALLLIHPLSTENGENGIQYYFIIKLLNFS